MTIVSVTEMWSKKTGQKTSSDGKTFKAAFQSAWQVEHSADADETEIISASGLPQLGDVKSGTTAVYCTSVGPSQRLGPAFSVVPVSWSGETGPADDDPLNKPPEIDYSSVTATEEIDADINGVPICNVNGEFAEGVKDEIWDYMLTVKRNFADVSTYALRLYARSYNSDTYYGWPPGTASLRSFKAKEVRYGPSNLYVYYEVTAQILFREPYNTTAAHAWYKRYRNEGLYERVGTTIEFTGGGGTGAAGYAVVSSSGVITAIPVTNRGYGYTSAPTVGITSDSGGSGATATATLNSNGQVTGVSVTGGGTGYRSALVRAVDGRKEPVTTPVLLKADGSREYNAASAVWLERPTKRPLPYAALGLL